MLGLHESGRTATAHHPRCMEICRFGPDPARAGFAAHGTASRQSILSIGTSFGRKRAVAASLMFPAFAGSNRYASGSRRAHSIAQARPGTAKRPPAGNKPGDKPPWRISPGLTGGRLRALHFAVQVPASAWPKQATRQALARNAAHGRARAVPQRWAKPLPNLRGPTGLT